MEPWRLMAPARLAGSKVIRHNQPARARGTPSRYPRTVGVWSACGVPEGHASWFSFPASDPTSDTRPDGSATTIRPGFVVVEHSSLSGVAPRDRLVYKGPISLNGVNRHGYPTIVQGHVQRPRNVVVSLPARGLRRR